MEAKNKTKVNLRALYNRSYAGQYVTATEIDKPTKVTISSLEVESVKSWKKGSKPEDKLILHFEGKDRGLVINKTNFKRLANEFGWEPEEWVGNEVTLESVEVEAFGRVVDSILVTPSSAQGEEKSIEERIEEGEVPVN